MERRELFRILAATTVSSASAQHNPPAAAKRAGPYQPRFFTAAEFELLDHVCETILPADDESGGARDARVPVYIDTIALYADEKSKTGWRSGLASVDQSCVQRFGKGFTVLGEGEREQMVAALLENERSPKNDAERFAVRLKSAVIEAWSVSDAGMKYFRYKGNRASYVFPGCTHAAHR
jgi:gluconate 2-dehydrogenase gamma chain